MTSPQVTVTHNLAAQRFEAVLEGQTAELTYRRADDEIVFTHTGVPTVLEGRGIGSALAKAGLDYAQAEGLTVVPLCSFIRAYIDRKPEYQPLVRKSAGGFA